MPNELAFDTRIGLFTTGAVIVTIDNSRSQPSLALSLGTDYGLANSTPNYAEGLSIGRRTQILTITIGPATDDLLASGRLAYSSPK